MNLEDLNGVWKTLGLPDFDQNKTLNNFVQNFLQIKISDFLHQILHL